MEYQAPGGRLTCTMALLVSRIQECSEGEASGYSYDGEDATVSIENPAAENGGVATSADGLSWLNSARIFAEPSEDRVILTCSIGDPRGAFAMEIRRLDDGRIVIHLPHPGEGMAHLPTAWLHDGTLVVTHEAGNADKPAFFSMESSEDDEP